MKAQAIVFREANQPSLEEIDLPDLQPGEMLTRTLYSGVSIGTESSIFSGARTHNGTFPLVGGYMATGVVEKVGPGVEGFAEGDRVVSGGSRLDGEISSIWGGHTSRSVIAAERALRLPEGVDPKEAALHVLPRVGLNAMKMAGIAAGETVLISGQGMIGQCFGQFAKRAGARVLAIEPDARRAALSRQYAAVEVFDPFDADLARKVSAATDGRGPDVVVEATASAKLIGAATAFLRSRSRMVFLSWYPGHVEIDFSHFHNNAVIAYFPTGSGDMDTAREFLSALAAGEVVVGDNLTDIVPWRESCAAYQRLIAGDRSVLGMVVDWAGS